MSRLEASPLVSVIMPAYNAATYIGAAIESILSQSLTNFELIIINDGCTDGTDKVVSSYQSVDRRVRFIENGKLGLVGACNLGIDSASGEFIARLDADDIALPTRLDRQVNFLRATDTLLCGTWARTFGDCVPGVVKFPINPEAISCALLFYCPIVHPSTMWRRESLTANGLSYRELFRGAEDYDLWARCAKHGPIRNIPEILQMYRSHKSQISKSDFNNRDSDANRLRSLQLEEFGVAFDGAEFDSHYKLSTWQSLETMNDLIGAERWLLKLKLHNKITGHLNREEFEAMLSNFWRYTCSVSGKLGIPLYRCFRKSKLSPSFARFPLSHMKILMKALLPQQSK